MAISDWWREYSAQTEQVKAMKNLKGASPAQWADARARMEERKRNEPTRS